MLTIYYSQTATSLNKNMLIGIEKLNSRQLYSVLVCTYPFTQISQKYFTELFKTDSFDWKQIYLLLHLVTLDSYSCSFQIKSRIMFFFEIKSFLSFKNRLHLFVLSAKSLMRQCPIIFRMVYN